MTKEEYRKASHFRDATKMVAAPGSLSGLFDSAPLFRVSFPWPVELPARDWRPALQGALRSRRPLEAAFLLYERMGTSRRYP